MQQTFTRGLRENEQTELNNTPDKGCPGELHRRRDGTPRNKVQSAGAFRAYWSGDVAPSRGCKERLMIPKGRQYRGDVAFAKGTFAAASL
jgi:hypothetical protein